MAEDTRLCSSDVMPSWVERVESCWGVMLLNMVARLGGMAEEEEEVEVAEDGAGLALGMLC